MNSENSFSQLLKSGGHIQSNASDCALCATPGGELVYQHTKFRVVWADEPLYPGFLRLIWQSHVPEFSQLSHEDRSLCMDAVVVLEQFALTHLKADKVNLATLGNVVPHLHWHVIPRFKGDAHFPAPVWAALPVQSATALTHQQQVIVQENNRLWACW
ncbi:MAG: HIT family protein [Limnobacter sp.]|nr:HIT family protein [Limnobacter sp.]